MNTLDRTAVAMGVSIDHFLLPWRRVVFATVVFENGPSSIHLEPVGVASCCFPLSFRLAWRKWLDGGCDRTKVIEMP